MLTKLQYLNLMNSFQQTRVKVQEIPSFPVPRQIGNLMALTFLDISSGNFNGSLPTELYKLTNLKYLSVNFNAFTGTISWLGKLISLTNLDMSFNYLTGTIPTSLGLLIALTSLNLAFQSGSFSLKAPRQPRPPLHGPIPSELGNLQDLHELVLSDNNLSGSLPSQLSKLWLFSLYLDNNSFGGTLPSWLNSFGVLSDLDLSCNRFVGKLPSMFDNMQSLNYLNISSNRLTGTIPSNLGTFLSYVDLSRNQLKGKIPVQLSDALYLHTLDISFNLLTGTIPSQLGDLSQLDTFDLHNNSIVGTMPAALCVLTNDNLSELIADCKKKVKCPSSCCTECYWRQPFSTPARWAKHIFYVPMHICIAASLAECDVCWQ